jgi:hypothetical protein
MAKLKARNIISGWPRPRSTVTSISYEGWSWVMYRALRLRVPFLCSLTELQQYDKDVKMYEFDFKYEKTYHQMQQAMVNEWFSRYRLGDKQFEVIFNDRYTRPGEVGKYMTYTLPEDMIYLEPVGKPRVYFHRKIK